MPTSKPQWMAFLTRADELFYGGAAGGGKSDLLLGLAGEAHERSIIFRRVFPNLRFLVERSKQLYGGKYGKYNESLHLWRLPDGKIMEFGAIQYEDDKTNYQGRPHDLIGFDEAAEFTESQVLFVTAWNRSTNPEQRVRVILTGNPPVNEAGGWLKRRYAAWLDKTHHRPAQPGELRWYVTVDGREMETDDGTPFVKNGEQYIPRSRTFIPAKLTDNPYLAADGRYRSVLQSLPEPLRSQLLYGDFDAAAAPDPFQVIPTAWVLAAQERWRSRQRPNTPLTAVGIDPSRGGEDKTALVMRYDNWFDEPVSWAGAVVKDGAILAELARQAIGNTDPYINIDVNGIGSSAYDHLKVMYRNVHPINVAETSDYRDRSGKLKMRNKRAEMYWRMRDALDPQYGDDIALPPSTELLADLCSARYEPTVSGVVIEPKEKIKERIGRSPDIGEAAMLALMPKDWSGAFVHSW